MNYAELRKELLYYKVIRQILYILSKNSKSIIDVGSNGVDLISDLPLSRKVSICLSNPVSLSGVEGIKINFFDYKSSELFDIVACFQVIEHIEDAYTFTQKLFETGKIVLISLPYKWPNGLCKYHCQDPVDEKKIYSWTKRKPDYTWICQENNRASRIICLYCSDSVYKKELNSIPRKIYAYPRFLKLRQMLVLFRLFFQ